MTAPTFLLVLIYSGLMVAAEPRDNLDACMKEARESIGKEAQVRAWDNMNGSHPIPIVVIAFCVEGYSK